MGSQQQARSMGDSYATAFGIGSTAGPCLARARREPRDLLACVNAIGTAIASLPALVYRATPARGIELRDHPVARLIRRPNAYQTWPALRRPR